MFSNTEMVILSGVLGWCPNELKNYMTLALGIR